MKERAEQRKANLGPVAGLATTEDETEFVISEEETLPKYCRRYSGWDVGLLEELFQYCEPGTFSITKKQFDSLQNARQRLEFAVGIKKGLLDGKTDSITNIAKSGHVLPLSTVHSERGRREEGLLGSHAAKGHREG